MSQRAFSLVVGVIFLLVALGHLLRIVFQWPAQVGGWEVPFWPGWIVVLVAGYLAYEGFRLSRKSS